MYIYVYICIYIYIYVYICSTHVYIGHISHSGIYICAANPIIITVCH